MMNEPRNGETIDGEKEADSPAQDQSSRRHSTPTAVDLVDNHEASEVAGETLDQVGAGGIELRPKKPRETASTTRSAFFVGAGILISRIVGLVRQRIFAHYFGRSAAGDAFSAAFRIPNFLQNIFGEGALSASFIPVYAKLLAQGDEEEAARVANAVLGLLALVTAIIVVVGILTTPFLIGIIAPGFQGETRLLTIRLVKILFPGAGL